MTDEMMTLRTLLEKSSDADLLRATPPLIWLYSFAPSSRAAQHGAL
jgi:hypothetical protein